MRGTLSDMRSWRLGKVAVREAGHNPLVRVTRDPLKWSKRVQSSLGKLRTEHVSAAIECVVADQGDARAATAPFTVAALIGSTCETAYLAPALIEDDPLDVTK
jgi:hypothetical protein